MRLSAVSWALFRHPLRGFCCCLCFYPGFRFAAPWALFRHPFGVLLLSGLVTQFRSQGSAPRVSLRCTLGFIPSPLRGSSVVWACYPGFRFTAPWALFLHPFGFFLLYGSVTEGFVLLHPGLYFVITCFARLNSACGFTFRCCTEAVRE